MNKNTKNSLFTFVILGLGFALFTYLSVFIYNWYQESCWKDHSKPLMQLGIPVQENMQVFFKKHQRYPTIEETNELLYEAGCRDIKNKYYKEQKNDSGEVIQRSASHFCDFKSTTYVYFQTINNVNIKDEDYNDYNFGLSKGNTECYTTFDNRGNSKRILRCRQRAICLRLYNG